MSRRCRKAAVGSTTRRFQQLTLVGSLVPSRKELLLPLRPGRLTTNVFYAHGCLRYALLKPPYNMTRGTGPSHQRAKAFSGAPGGKDAVSGSSAKLVPGGPCNWCGVTATPQVGNLYLIRDFAWHGASAPIRLCHVTLCRLPYMYAIYPVRMLRVPGLHAPAHADACACVPEGSYISLYRPYL